MRWRIPRYGIFFMVVMIVMGLGLLFLVEQDSGPGLKERPEERPQDNGGENVSE